jgi:maltose O-acetyltransferase
MNSLQKKLIENPIGKLFGYLHAYLERCDRYQHNNSYRKKYKIDKTFMFSGKDIILDGEGTIICGANSYVGHRTTLVAGLGTMLKVGANCKIAADFYARTENYAVDQIFNGLIPKRKSGSIIIGDGCWIGQGVFIREGVTVGEQCVIGAGSVVLEDLPAFSVCVGVPCKPVKFKSEWWRSHVDAEVAEATMCN